MSDDSSDNDGIVTDNDDNHASANTGDMIPEDDIAEINVPATDSLMTWPTDSLNYGLATMLAYHYSEEMISTGIQAKAQTWEELPWSTGGALPRTPEVLLLHHGVENQEECPLSPT
jgi:hypothetical protein